MDNRAPNTPDSRLGGHQGATSAKSTLRYNGFCERSLAIDSEWASEGQTSHNELIYCASGEVLLLVWRGHESIETFSVSHGEFIFLPTGTSYSIFNAADKISKLIVASSRDASHGGEVEGGRSISYLIEGVSWSARCDDQLPCHDDMYPTLEIAGARGESDHVVLYRDERDAIKRFEPTIDNMFDKQLIAREFGIPAEQIPDLSVSNLEPIAIRHNSPHGE